MDKILDIVTEHTFEIKTLFEVLKENLNEAKIDIIRDANQQNNTELKKKKNTAGDSSDSESEEETTKKNKKNAKKKTKDSSDESDDEPKSKTSKKVLKSTAKKNKKSKKTNSSDDESDDESDKKKNKKIQKKNKKTDSSSDESEDESDDESTQKSKNDKANGGGGIRILALDEHQTLLIYVKLNADQFVNFYVKPTIHSIGLDLIQFHKFMKTVDKDSVMRIYIDKDDEQNIVFELQNNVKNNSSIYKQKLLDIDDNTKKLPQETNFEMSVTMDTADFRKICTEMNQFSEYVEITCTSKEITFKCQGDSNAFVKSFKNSEAGVKIISLKNNGTKGSNIVQAIYNLKHLVTFGKCVNLCDGMQLFLKNDYPLFINYHVGPLGKMLVGLSPVDEKAIKRDNDYDENIDKYYNEKKVAIKEI